ncbi:protein translation factor SUI1 homolog 2 [Tanacetum coccineum]
MDVRRRGWWICGDYQNLTFMTIRGAGHTVPSYQPGRALEADPFAEATTEDSGARTIKKDFSYNKILKDLKKEFCCNGTFVQDFELGQVYILKLEISSLFKLLYNVYASFMKQKQNT